MATAEAVTVLAASIPIQAVTAVAVEVAVVVVTVEVIVVVSPVITKRNKKLFYCNQYKLDIAVIYSYKYLHTDIFPTDI